MTTVPKMTHQHLVSLILCGPEFFAKPRPVFIDDSSRRLQDGMAGAIIAFQTNDVSIFKIAFKMEDVGHLCAAPAIDGLVIISHTANIAMVSQQHTQPQVLCRVGVLILIHQNMFKLFLPQCGNLFIALEQSDDMQNEVAKVAAVHGKEPLLIGAIELKSFAIEAMMILLIQLTGCAGVIFPLVNGGGDKAFGDFFSVQTEILHDVFDESQLVIVIKDDEIGLESDGFGVASENTRAQRMKCANKGGRLQMGVGEQLGNPLFHFAGGFVGKGDRQNALWVNIVFQRQPGNARGEGFCFARASTGKNQQRTVFVTHRFLLFFIEIIHMVMYGVSHGFMFNTVMASSQAGTDDVLAVIFWRLGGGGEFVASLCLFASGRGECASGTGDGLSHCAALHASGYSS